MDVAAAQEFIRRSHRAVLATYRVDGAPQLSPVTADVDPDGFVNYRAAMERDRRVLLRITMDRVGPTKSG